MICGIAARSTTPPQDAALARAQAARGAHQVRLHALHAGDGAEQDRKEAAEEDDELVLRVADAEPQDRERDPGERRDGAQHLDQRVDLLLDRPPPAHGDAERDRGGRPEERLPPRA
jgi:hypothetical protein